jgi:hypothetical protein
LFFYSVVRYSLWTAVYNSVHEAIEIDDHDRVFNGTVSACPKYHDQTTYLAAYGTNVGVTETYQTSVELVPEEPEKITHGSEQR